MLVSAASTGSHERTLRTAVLSQDRRLSPPHVIATSPLAPCGRTRKVTRPGQPMRRQVVLRPHRTKPVPRAALAMRPRFDCDATPFGSRG